MNSIRETFADKVVFIAGGGGFLGKVFLEKLLRECRRVKHVYMLMRPKAGRTVQERVVGEVMKSPCFDPLKKIIEVDEGGGEGAFEAFFVSKISAVAGEVSKDEIGLAASDIATLREHVQIWVNCAATVDFHEAIQLALRTNALGALEQIRLAQSCPKIIAFLHVSTAYVNCDRRGDIREDIYPLRHCSDNIDDVVDEILSMTKEEAAAETPRLIGEYPNTYSFTKSVCEHLIQKYKGDLPVAIVRPSCIGAAMEEPRRGWVDVVNAAGALYLQCGVGVLKICPGDFRNIGDQIPVDHTANTMLAAVPSVAGQPSKFMIYHSTTSDINPVTWGFSSRCVIDYWSRNRPNVAISGAEFRLIPNSTVYETAFWLRHRAPLKAYTIYTKLFGNETSRKQQRRLQRVTDRVAFFAHTFAHFTSHTWYYSSANTQALRDALSPDERERFDFDAHRIDWADYLRSFCYGLHRFIIKEDDLTSEPHYERDLNVERVMHRGILDANAPFMPDIQWAAGNREGIARMLSLPETEAIKGRVLSSGRLRQVVDSISESPAARQAAMARASEILDVMSANLRVPVVRTMAWFFRKVWRRIYSEVAIDEAGVVKLRRALKQGPVVFLPTHRSYIDFLMLSYVLFTYDLPLPHIASGVDFLNMAIVNWFLRSAGAFYMRRTFRDDPVYKTVFAEYITTFLGAGHHLEFFVEGTRSRSGKASQPKYGIMNILTDAVLDERVTAPVNVVPVVISYECVLETDSYIKEMRGESKTQESLTALLRARSILNRDFGRVEIKFLDPIPLDPPVTSALHRIHSESNAVVRADVRSRERDDLSAWICAQTMAASQRDVTVTSLMAIAVLANRHANMSLTHLSDTVAWLEQCAVAQGGYLACTGVVHRTDSRGRRNPVRDSGGAVFNANEVQRGLHLMSSYLTQYAPDGAVGPNTAFRVPLRDVETLPAETCSLLALAFARNSVLPLFKSIALIATAVLADQVTATGAIPNRAGGALGDGSDEAVGVPPVPSSDAAPTPIAQIYEDYIELDTLLQLEFANVPDCPDSLTQSPFVREHILDRIRVLESLGVLARNDGDTVTTPTAETCSRLACLASAVQPLLEAYWLATTALLTLHAGGRTTGITRRDIISHAQWVGDELRARGRLYYAEACTTESLENALSLFQGHLRILTIGTDDSIRMDIGELNRLSTRLGRFTGHNPIAPDTLLSSIMPEPRRKQVPVVPRSVPKM